MDCSKINLKRGSSGGDVKTLQTLLTTKKLYTGKIDGDYGVYTENAVKNYQRSNGLLVDGIYGPVTCKKLTGQNNNNMTKTASGDSTGVYTSVGHFVNPGCDKLGQCTSTFCAPHSIHQTDAKKDLEKYADEYRLAGWAGTTSAGTSHAGIETAFYELSKRSGIKIKLEWKNLSDMGASLKDRMQAIGRIIENPNKFVIWHILYRKGKSRNPVGHYESVKWIDINKMQMGVMNSLGTKCSSTSFCGYMETRNCSEMATYCSGISQKSILIITFE